MVKPLKKVSIILNPASGPDYPILAAINRQMRKKNIKWDLYLTKKKNDGTRLAKYILRHQTDAIIVGAGDGTVAEVASQTYTTNLPIGIIPCGTANIFAKELGIPIDITQALEVVTSPTKVVSVDVAKNDQVPFFLRIEAGLLADAVKSATRKQKKQIGPLAYSLNTIQHMLTTTPSTYYLELDGKKASIPGVGLMIANIGNIGIPGVSIQPNVNCSDDKLDVFVFQSLDIVSLLGISSSTLIGTEKPDSLKHWQISKTLKVEIDPPQTVVRDDKVVTGNIINVSMEKTKLQVLL